MCCISSQIVADNYLKNEWKFILGDNINYKNNGYIITEWKSIYSGDSWENQSYDKTDGFGWYVQDVVIPSKVKRKIYNSGGLSLYLGTVDDADEVYLNGKLIAKTGQFPPTYEGYYERERNYIINPDDVLWGQKNRIAVRVYDGGGNGGITGKNIYLKIIGEEADIVVIPKFPSKERVFLSTNNLTANILIRNNTQLNHKVVLNFCVTNDLNDTIKTWTQTASINKGKIQNFNLNFATLPAGFYKTTISSNKEDFQPNDVHFAVTPERVISDLNQPNDFENFWLRAKRELAAVEPQYKLIKIDSLCTDKRDVYLVEMRSLENVLIRGFYGRPKVSGKFPAILHLQGYSSFQNMNRAYKGDSMAVFVLNVRGHGNSKDNINPGFPGYLQFNLKDRERYIYRGAYMDCIRAIDFLCSRAEVDTSMTVVEGGSQGGALSIATAALDNIRVKLCIPSVPFLSDFRTYFKIALWPANEFTAFVNNNPDFSWENLYENLAYFDIKNLAPWIKCPVLMSVGLKDKICPPRINFAAYNQITSPKQYLVFPENGHSLPADYETLRYNWMRNEIVKNRIKNKQCVN